MDIIRIDPRDEQALEAWFAVYHVAKSHERAFHTAFTLQEMRAEFLQPEPGWRLEPYSLVRDGSVVAVGSLGLTLLDNLDMAWVAVGVLPEHRRQGLGSAVLEVLESAAREAGRSRLIAEADSPYDGGQDAEGEFFGARGYSLGLDNVQRVLDLPVEETLLDKLEAHAAERHAGYTFVNVSTPLPDELVLAVGQIRADVGQEAPMGDIPLEPEHVDVDRVRGEERMLEAQGRQGFATLAFDASGALAGYTEVGLSHSDKPWLYQWGTLVRRDHRGRSLGLALKVRNTRWLQELFPDRAAIRTWNADVNAHMIAVNELLGYRPVARLGEWQKTLG